MNTYLKSIYVCILLFTQHLSSGQQLENILKEIRATNEVHCEGIGFAGEKSKQYINYENLAKIATIADLLELTNDSNGVVNCYATWALMEKHYNEVPTIFSKSLRNNKEIAVFCGCEKYPSTLSEEIYFRYRSLKGRDETVMRAIDNLVLYSDNSGWLPVHFALESRVYPPVYNKRLEHLAFKMLNRDAIFYLKMHLAHSYQSKIKSALLQYLHKTDFSKTGTTDYFDIVAALLEYRDKNVNKIIFNKLKKDTHWENDYGKFYGLFGEYKLEKKLPDYANLASQKYQSEISDKAYETSLKDSSCTFWTLLLTDSKSTGYLGIDTNHIDRLTILDKKFSFENCNGGSAIRNVNVVKDFDNSDISDLYKPYCFINASWYTEGKYGMTIVSDDAVIYIQFTKKNGRWVISECEKRE